MSQTILTLLNELIDSVSDPQLSEFASLLPRKSEAVRDVAPNSLPVLAYLARCVASAPTVCLHLLHYLEANREALRWGQTYSADDFGADFLNGYGWTEFIGTRGPIPSHALACGVLMLGPQITYPSHSHQAEEVYLPLCGLADWQMGHGNWVKREPLEVIHHLPWVPHAMCTGDEPMIALYFWRGGDLAEKSRIG